MCHNRFTIQINFFTYMYKRYKNGGCAYKNIGSSLLETRRLDYYDHMYFGIPKQKLIQNTTARFVTVKKKYGHITPTLLEQNSIGCWSRIGLCLSLFFLCTKLL